MNFPVNNPFSNPPAESTRSKAAELFTEAEFSNSVRGKQKASKTEQKLHPPEKRKSLQGKAVSLAESVVSELFGSKQKAGSPTAFQRPTVQYIDAAQSSSRDSSPLIRSSSSSGLKRPTSALPSTAHSRSASSSPVRRVSFADNFRSGNRSDRQQNYNSGNT